MLEPMKKAHSPLSAHKNMDDSVTEEKRRASEIEKMTA